MSVRELDLYDPILATGPLADKKFAREIRIADWSHSRRTIDLVTTDRDRTISVEVKVSNWRKAMQQAYANLYVTDYSYMALWHKAADRADKVLCKKLGIGILRVDDSSCSMDLKPRKSRLVVKSRHEYVRNEYECDGRGRAI